MILALGITARLDFIAQTAHLSSQCVPVDLSQVGPPFIQP